MAEHGVAIAQQHGHGTRAGVVPNVSHEHSGHRCSWGECIYHQGPLDEEAPGSPRPLAGLRVSPRKLQDADRSGPGWGTCASALKPNFGSSPIEAHSLPLAPTLCPFVREVKLNETDLESLDRQRLFAVLRAPSLVAVELNIPQIKSCLARLREKNNTVDYLWKASGGRLPV